MAIRTIREEGDEILKESIKTSRGGKLMKRYEYLLKI